MKFIENVININGRNFFYWEKNPGQKPVIIFLHGFPGSHKGIIDMASNLKGYRLIVPDLPACGQSEALVRHNLKNYAQWLYDLLEELGIKKAIVIGHSFGARVALVFGNRYPAKVINMVLITPVVKVEGFIARLASLYYKVAGVLPGYLQKVVLSNGFGKKWGDKIIFKSASPKLQKEIIANDIIEIKKMNQQIAVDLFEEFYRSRTILVTVKANEKHFLIIAGDLDEIAPVDSVQELADQLSYVTLKIMKNSGHLVPLERPGQTGSIILDWLKQ